MVEQGQADIGITGISITQVREEVIDFALPYFEAGLSILTPLGGTSSWATPLQMLRSLLGSSAFLRITAALAVLIVAMGHVFWLLERRRTPDFPKPYLQGLGAGMPCHTGRSRSHHRGRQLQPVDRNAPRLRSCRRKPADAQTVPASGPLSPALRPTLDPRLHHATGVGDRLPGRHAHT
jgi:hypothetical protein